MINCITVIVQSYVNKSYLKAREGCEGTSIQITTIVCHYPHVVPRVEGQYSGVTGSISANSPPTWVSICQELAVGAISVQRKVTATNTGTIGHCMPHEHIGPHHRGREEPSRRVVTRSFVCFYVVVYHSLVGVVREAWCQICSKPDYPIWNVIHARN